jgi:hypothetical protein
MPEPTEPPVFWQNPTNGARIRWEGFDFPDDPAPTMPAPARRRWWDTGLAYRLLWEWSENATYTSDPVPLGLDDMGYPMARCKGDRSRYERLNVWRYPFHLYAYLHGRITRRVAFLESFDA